MGVEFADRSTWRNRGRPPAPADPRVVELVRRTHETGTVARLKLDQGDTADDVRKTLGQLRRAADVLGLRLRIQPRRSREILAEGEIRFFGEDE